MKVERICGKQRRWRFYAWQVWSAAERKRQNLRFSWLDLGFYIYGNAASVRLTVLGCGLVLSTYKVA